MGWEMLLGELRGILVAHPSVFGEHPVRGTRMVGWSDGRYFSDLKLNLSSAFKFSNRPPKSYFLVNLCKIFRIGS